MSPFLPFCQTAEDISATSSRLEKARILGDYLRELPDDDLRRAALWFGGTPFPLRENRVAQIGGAALSNATQQVSGADADWLAARLVATGDPGETAFEAWSHWPDAPSNATLTLQAIERALAQLAATRGSKAKLELVVQTLRNSTALEAKYWTKMLGGDLRIGLKESAVEDALARLYQTELARVQRANMLSGDLGEVAVLARHGRLDEAVFELFHPLKFMLATPATDNDEIARVMPLPFRVEDKFDGIRAQAHIAPHRAHDQTLHGQNFGEVRVALFSRALNEITGAFPDLGEPLAALLDNEAGLVLDGEIVPLENGAIAPFQNLQKRLNRKKPSAEILAQTPLAFIAYDLLFAGHNELELPLEARRARLEKLRFDGAQTRIAASTLFPDIAALDAEFEAARARGNEGLMLKDPQSDYKPGKRGRQWLKVKKATETLDVVVTSVESGSGRRSKFYSDYTFAVRASADGPNAFERRQSLFGPDRRRDHRTVGLVYRAYPANLRARARPHRRAEDRVGDYLRQGATFAPPQKRLRAALSAHRAAPRRQAGRGDRHVGGGGEVGGMRFALIGAIASFQSIVR